MKPSPVNTPDEADVASRAAERSPLVPNERDAWIGMAATLILCLVAAVVYFWVSGVHGK